MSPAQWHHAAFSCRPAADVCRPSQSCDNTLASPFVWRSDVKRDASFGVTRFARVPNWRCRQRGHRVPSSNKCSIRASKNSSNARMSDESGAFITGPAGLLREEVQRRAHDRHPCHASRAGVT